MVVVADVVVVVIHIWGNYRQAIKEWSVHITVNYGFPGIEFSVLVFVGFIVLVITRPNTQITRPNTQILRNGIVNNIVNCYSKRQPIPRAVFCIFHATNI